MSRVTIQHTKNYVVLSLSELPDEPLMWGHYAVSLTGFVIGFDIDQEILIGHSAHRKLGKVTYSKVRPTKPRLEDFTEDEIFFTKRDAWSYEREWRILDVQDSATSGPPSKTAYDTRMFTLNPAAVVEVICGWRGSAARENIQNILRRKEFEHVVLKNAQPDQRLYEIRLADLPRVDWEYWYLNTMPGASTGV